MRLIWKILLGLALVLVVAVVGVYWYLRPLLLTGTGYAAHNACALQFISDRDDASSDLPPNPLVPYLSVSVGSDGATATILGIFAKQTAHYTAGFGCAIADNAPELPTAHPVAAAHPFLDSPAPEAPAAIDTAIDAAFADGLGTRAVLVIKDGELIAERYADGFDVDTPQLGWSMTKSVTNLLVGRAVAESGYDIHATGLIDGWDDERARISPDHLMRMTGGLAWDETYDLGTPITEMLYIEEDMGEFVAELEAEFAPGEFFEYSTGSSNLLCSVLVDQLDADANLPRELLLDPLGLTSAQWETDAAGTPVCGSYLWATPREWAAIGQFVLDDGVIDGERLLPEGWIEQAVTPTMTDTGPAPGYGASWWLNDDGDDALVHADFPADLLWASGHDGQLLYLAPSEDLIVLRMGFSPGLGSSGTGSEQLLADVLEALSTQ